MLHAFPTAQRLKEAGFEKVWATAGAQGVKRATLRRLVDLAANSAGMGNDLWASQLQLLIEEYWEIGRRIERYAAEMTAICERDVVLASLMAIPCLPIQGLAAIVGAMGDVGRFRDADQVKKYLNVAPCPLPQSGNVDETGRPVQRWRFPSNSYEKVNGQRRIKYQSPGRKEVRGVGYIWFQTVMQNQRRLPHDPFVLHYVGLKAAHQDQSAGWGGCAGRSWPS